MHSNTELNPLFHTFAEFRLIVNRIVVRQSTDWLAANAQFSPNAHVSFNTVVDFKGMLFPYMGFQNTKNIDLCRVGFNL